MKVDLREVYLVISFVKTRYEKMPILIERASDHLSILTDTVRLVLDLDLLSKRFLIDCLVPLILPDRFVPLLCWSKEPEAANWSYCSCWINCVLN